MNSKDMIEIINLKCIAVPYISNYDEHQWLYLRNYKSLRYNHYTDNEKTSKRCLQNNVNQANRFGYTHQEYL